MRKWRYTSGWLDSGTPLVAFGASIHNELACQVDARIPLAKVLEMATSINAKLLGRDNIGTIAVEKLVDLIIIDGDQLTKSTDTKKS